MPASVTPASWRRPRRSISRQRKRSSLRKDTSICLSLDSNGKSTEGKNVGEHPHRRRWSRSSSPRRDRANFLTAAWPSPQQHKKAHAYIPEMQRRFRTKISTEDERIARQTSIISKLGLIPGEKAMAFAEAYDSISWLPIACKKIGLSPPFSPPNEEKFNLMPRPAKFSKAMKLMTVLNKYGKDILSGTRKNCGQGCNLDANYEKLIELSRPSTTPTFAVIRIPTLEKAPSPKPKKRAQFSGERIRNAALLSSGIRLGTPYNRKCCEHPSDNREGPRTQSKSTNTCEHCVTPSNVNKDISGQNRFSTPVADRILKLARFHITGSTQHKGTNTEPALNFLSYGPTFSENDNLPIFFKYYNVSPKPLDVSPPQRFIKGYNC